jgi:general stress protein 26
VITRATLLEFMRSHRYAVAASVGSNGGPQGAVVGIAVSDTFEIVFDTLASTRKAQNLRRQPKLALVVGSLAGDDQRTVQYEGVADEPRGADLVRVTDLYLAKFPDGRERQQWPGLIYVRATPTWIRYSDFNQNPPEIVELDREALERLP